MGGCHKSDSRAYMFVFLREILCYKKKRYVGVDYFHQKPVLYCGVDLSSLFSVNENGNWSWSLCQSGIFSVASLRKRLDSYLLQNNLGFQTYWSKLIPGKVFLHGWKAQHRRLATFDNLFKRKIMQEQKQCQFCHLATESEDHLFA